MPPLTQDEPFELKGEWWRADGAELIEEFKRRPPATSMPLDEGFGVMQTERDRLQGTDAEHACRGPLRFDPEDGLRLSLLGASAVAFPTHAEQFTVLGYTAKGLGCSLLECFVTSSNTELLTGFADRQVFGHVLLHGVHAESLSDLVVDRVEVDIPGLLDFLWAPSHDERGKARPGLRAAFEAREPASHTVELDGAEIQFSVGSRLSSSTHQRTHTREALATVTLEEPVPFPVWRERWLEPLVRLVTFASGQPTVQRQVVALLPHQEESAKGPRYHPVHVIQNQGRPPEFTSRPERMLVSYAALESSFDSFILSWWEVHERLAGAGDFLFGALRGHQSMETQLVTLASVCEGYHRAFHPDALSIDAEKHAAFTRSMLEVVQDEPEARGQYERALRYANELNQQQRLHHVLTRAGEVVAELGMKTGRLAEAVVATRNYFVHHGERNAQVIGGVRNLWEANQLLILALKCNLLLDLGLSPEGALRGVRRAHVNQVLLPELKRRGAAWPMP